MTKFESKEELLKGIEQHFSQLNEGRLSIEQLEQLVVQTRELYERALVLRYKAYEEKVFGDLQTVLEDQNNESAAEISPLYEERGEEDNQEEQIMAESELEKPADEPAETIFDFDLFDDKEEKPFILENVDTSDQGGEERLQSETEARNIESTWGEGEMPDESTQFNANQTSLEENVLSAEDSTPETNLPEDEIDEILRSVLVDEDSLASRMMFTKLDTLIGSFGFNERFQSVKELFNDSNDDFNQALIVLDQLENFEEAKKQLLFYIHLHKWDLTNQTTVDFIQKVHRRYC